MESRKELGLGGLEALVESGGERIETMFDTRLQIHQGLLKFLVHDCYRNHSTKACRERRKVDGSSEARRKASGGLVDFKGYSNGHRIASTAPMETGVSCWKL